MCIRDRSRRARYTEAPPITKLSSGAAASRASRSRYTSAPSGAKPGLRDRIRFLRPFRGRPPGKVSRVFRPKITGCPVVNVLNRLRSWEMYLSDETGSKYQLLEFALMHSCYKTFHVLLATSGIVESHYLEHSPTDRKSTRLNSSHSRASRMPSSA